MSEQQNRMSRCTKRHFIPPAARSMSRAFSARSRSIKDPGALPQAGIEAAPSASKHATADLTIAVCENKPRFTGNFGPTRFEKQVVRHRSNPSLKGQSLSQIHVSLYSQLLRKHLKVI